jgi:hypothetical protein
MEGFLTLAFALSIGLALGYNLKTRAPDEGYDILDLLVWVPAVLIVMLFNFLDSTSNFDF